MIPLPSSSGSTEPGEAPRVCSHRWAEHSSRYDLRCTYCGISSLEAEESDRIMLVVWQAWCKAQGNEGAARLFERTALRLKKVREEESKTRAALRASEERVATLEARIAQDQATVAWSAIECALQMMREPMELRDARAGRDMLVRVSNDHKRAVLSVPRGDAIPDSATGGA